MYIDFESTGLYITAFDDDNNVAIRCNSSYTDLKNDESILHFIKRHGEVENCIKYLKDAYKKQSLKD